MNEGNSLGQGYNRPTGCSAKKAPHATFNFFNHMLSQNYCIQPDAVPELLYPTCYPRTTVSNHLLSQNYCIQSHTIPELLYPATCCPRTTVSSHSFISLISIPHSSWFTTGIRYSLWESRKLNSCNICIHKLSDIQQLWHTLKLIHSQTADTWLWFKLCCCKM